MKEYEVVVEDSTMNHQLIRDTVEEVVYSTTVSNSTVFVVRTSYIQRLYDVLDHTGLAYVIEEMSDDE